MGVFQVECRQSYVEVRVCPQTRTEHGHNLEGDGIVVVKSRVDAGDDQPKLLAMDIEPFEPMAGEAFPLRLKVASAALSEQLIGELKSPLAAPPGDAPGFLHPSERQVLRLPPAWTVEERKRVVQGKSVSVRVDLGGHSRIKQKQSSH